MKILKLITIVLLLVCLANAQQINHTWGYTTAGVAYTQTGAVDVDSAATTSIVFDMQDYYPLDFNPLVNDDSAVVAINSNRMFYGTFWLYVDVETATDTTSININAYPGFMTYYSGTGDRISTSNLTFSTTATAVLNEVAYTANDRQWFATNVYISDTEGKILPPEFIKLAITFDTATNDSLDIYWDFVYPASKQHEQELRSTTNPGNAMKDAESLH